MYIQDFFRTTLTTQCRSSSIGGTCIEGPGGSGAGAPGPGSEERLRACECTHAGGRHMQSGKQSGKQAQEQANRQARMYLRLARVASGLTYVCSSCAAAVSLTSPRTLVSSPRGGELAH
ncbi:uncharacterized protein LOC143217618 [Lasioglossum baleicum]|uniref:uncharacterized protein LOC143217618 n=1 Tax=Lasioglossum baleicum TaxID=434251 RepID=UPI003FCDE4EF